MLFRSDGGAVSTKADPFQFCGRPRLSEKRVITGAQACAGAGPMLSSQQFFQQREDITSDPAPRGICQPGLEKTKVEVRGRVAARDVRPGSPAGANQFSREVDALSLK